MMHYYTDLKEKLSDHYPLLESLALEPLDRFIEGCFSWGITLFCGWRDASDRVPAPCHEAAISTKMETPSMITSFLMAISLVDVAEYYQGLPYQRQALEIFEERIRSTYPNWLTDDSEFVETWRNQVETAEVFPQANIITDGEQLQVELQEKTYTIDASDLSAFVLNTFDSATGETVDREMSGERFTGLSINPSTGEIAVGVFLDYFAATTTSAVFIIEPQPDGYTTRVAQLPGPRPLPSESSTYPFASLSGVRFVADDLQVTHSDAAGNSALEVFSSRMTPPLKYAGCVDLLTVAETSGLCSAPSES